MPQHADLHNFRANMDLRLTDNRKHLEDQQTLLAQNLQMLLTEREVSENQWKHEFEATINARIQDVWNGLASTQQQLEERAQGLQREMLQVEMTTKETRDIVDIVQQHVRDLDRRLLAQEEQGQSHTYEIAHLHALHKQNKATILSNDQAQQLATQQLNARCDAADTRHQVEQSAYLGFVANVEKTLAYCTSELTTTQQALENHDARLLSHDGGLTSHRAELQRVNEHLHKSDTRQGALNGRLMQQEKQLTTLTQVLQEEQHERKVKTQDLQKQIETAAQDRTSMKRQAMEMSFAVQEVQQTLTKVSKMAATTELALTRTAAEIPKLHNMVTTNTATLTATRHTLSDVRMELQDEKQGTKTHREQLAKEAAAISARFQAQEKRDDDADLAIQTTNTTMQQIRHSLEESIKYNSNMIHQLNSMVDALAITENITDMDEKLAKFALQVAEVGLKLEHFVATPGSSEPPTASVGTRDEIRGDLAILLSKIVRFLGSGVAIEQNKYFLANRRLVDSSTTNGGALVLEMPAHHILEGFRTAKAALFTTRMRTFMDQLRPVARTVHHIHKLRDHFERHVRYILEFGLANLFPNGGRPKNPNRRNDLGTCIACDRPLDPDAEHDEYGCTGDGEDCRTAATRATEAELEAVRARRAAVASAGVARKIDTRTAVKGRSGTTWSHPSQRPKASASEAMMNHPPGTTEFVYRAGFRLPRPASASPYHSSSKGMTEQQLAFTGLVAGSVSSEPDASNNHGQTATDKLTLDDSVSSCLERVGLVGRCEPVTIPGVKSLLSSSSSSSAGSLSSSASSPSLTRPHSAPHRAKSLPRLEIVDTKS
ncbi:TPA: hypothetical protein N0F65_006766 [Lagenidium giganteum]|uniref:Uncharacterized protein n=1 Tax=Lagenidium giganteum TaxID=4803 RepID=A0AAV2ZDF3_9STRA|nr:TPA: hypothetical protein N0F65_006766 [Lagenidium giganteum]